MEEKGRKQIEGEKIVLKENKEGGSESTGKKHS